VQGRDQLGADALLPPDLPNPPVYSKVNPADTPIITLGLTSATLPAAPGRGPGRYAARPEDRSAPWRRPRQHQRWAAARGAGCRPNPAALSAYGLTLEDLRVAVASANVNQAKGSFDGPRQSSVIGGQRPAPDESGLQAPHRRLPQQCPGHPRERGRRDRRRRERAPGGLDERHARDHREHPATARRQRDRGGGPHPAAVAAAAGPRCRRRSTSAYSPTAPSRSADRSRTSSSS